MGLLSNDWYPVGTVMQGDYKDCYVYWWNANELRIYSESKITYWGNLSEHLASAKKFPLEVVTGDTVDVYELMSETERNASGKTVIGATLLLGVGAGLLATQLGKGSDHVVAVRFKNGKTSMLKLDKQGYEVFLSAVAFKLNNKKAIEEPKKPAAPQIEQADPKKAMRVSGDPKTLMVRAFMFLEDKDWENAEIYCESVLDQEPQNAEAYLGKLMAEKRISLRRQLENQTEAIVYESNYQKAYKYATPDLRAELDGYINTIRVRKEETRKNKAYNDALAKMRNAKTEDDFKNAARIFNSVKDWKDAGARARTCTQKADIIRKDTRYNKALSLIKTNDEENIKQAISLFTSIAGYKDADKYVEQHAELVETARKNKIYIAAYEDFQKSDIPSIEKAKAAYESIPGWKDADDKAQQCAQKIEDIKAAEEAARIAAEQKKEQAEALKKKTKKLAMIIVPAVVVVVAAILLVVNVIIPSSKYNKAMSLKEEGKYDEAIAAFTELGDYKDSAAQIENCKTDIVDTDYKGAVALKEEGKYAEAIAAFEELGDYKDSASQINDCKYLNAAKLKDDGKYYDAAQLFAEISEYKDSTALAAACWDNLADRKAISAGAAHTVGLKADGTVIAIGDNNSSQCAVSTWKDIIAVSAGGQHTLGLKADGTVVATGSNTYGQCKVEGMKNVVAVAAGDEHTVCLMADGTVAATGNNNDGQCGVTGWTDIVSVGAGADHTVGLKSDGTVVAVGHNGQGQCDVTGWTDIIAIAVGANHTVGLKADGTVVAVGLDKDGQCKVENWADIASISAGSTHTVGLKADGTVVAVGNSANDQCKVDDLKDIVEIAAGDTITLALKADGTVAEIAKTKIGEGAAKEWTGLKTGIVPQAPDEQPTGDGQTTEQTN